MLQFLQRTPLKNPQTYNVMEMLRGDSLLPISSFLWILVEVSVVGASTGKIWECRQKYQKLYELFIKRYYVPSWNELAKHIIPKRTLFKEPLCVRFIIIFNNIWETEFCVAFGQEFHRPITSSTWKREMLKHKNDFP